MLECQARAEWFQNRMSRVSQRMRRESSVGARSRIPLRAWLAYANSSRTEIQVSSCGAPRLLQNTAFCNPFAMKDGATVFSCCRTKS